MERPPNVVVCMCDQLRAFEVGCYGNAVVRTPHMDRLAREGVRFEHAVTPNPVCMPARACLLSGQYTRTCMGEMGNRTERGPDGKPRLPEYPVEERSDLPDPTLPELLKRMGYETALVGKWHVHPAPHRVGFDFCLYPRVHHSHTGQTFIETGKPERVVEGYSVEFEANRVRDYLMARRDRPFFLFYNISPPHMPLMDMPEAYRTMYAPEAVPLRPNVYRDGRRAHSEEWFRIYRWDFLYYQERLPHTVPLPGGFDLRHLTALYYGATTWADAMVGRLLESLADSGRDRDTLVVFTSDHGDNLGSHHRFNKSELYEESIRIPLLFRAPGRWKPRVNAAQVASLVDLLPTLLEACGGEVPPHVQGRSLLPLLAGERETLDDPAAFVETDNGQVGVRTPTHLYGLRRGAPGGEEARFFDLRADPYQMRDLAATDAQADRAARLRERLRERLLAWDRATPRRAAR